MKARKVKALVMTFALTAAMLVGCGGGNSGGASSSAGTAQAEASASTEEPEEETAEEETAEEETATEEETTADEAVAGTAEDGDLHPGRFRVVDRKDDGSPVITESWLEMNDDGTGTFCREGTEYDMSYSTTEMGADFIESFEEVLTGDNMFYLIEAEDGTKLQGFYMMEMFSTFVVDEFMLTDEAFDEKYDDDIEFLYMIEEGTEAWDTFLES